MMSAPGRGLSWRLPRTLPSSRVRAVWVFLWRVRASAALPHEEEDTCR